ncbi:MAG: DnaA/Hda family protein [Rhodobacteraceae bacterium]|nr:DnaA/Hda family protein [Paracoccaceae bacterium]
MMMHDSTTPDTLDIRPPRSHRREDFVRSASNAAAYEAVLGEADWPDRRLILAGPAKSGKSHLARIWAENRSALQLSHTELAAPGIAQTVLNRNVLVHHVEMASGERDIELGLFHLCNTVAGSRFRLLMTVLEPPKQAFGLPDLHSRMQASARAVIEPPEDSLLALLLTKHLADRQISVAANVIDFILPRMERTHAMAGQLAAELDRQAMATGRAISRTTAAAALTAVRRPG